MGRSPGVGIFSDPGAGDRFCGEQRHCSGFDEPADIARHCATLKSASGASRGVESGNCTAVLIDDACVRIRCDTAHGVGNARAEWRGK